MYSCFVSCRTGMAKRMLRNVAAYGIALWTGMLSSSALAQIEPTVTLHYIQRPPYMTSSGNSLTGLTGEPSFEAFKNAKIPFVIAETPFARQLHMIEKNSGRDCVIGVFKKPEREAFAKFTNPIYKDQPQIILTAAANAQRFAKINSVTDLFADESVILLVKLGYSYGVALDKLIEQHQPRARTTTDENLLMIKSIKLRTTDYMLIAPEEAAIAITAAGFSEKDFAQIKFNNMPDGEYRQIMCSKNVPDELINKLNAAITFEKR